MEHAIKFIQEFVQYDFKVRSEQWTEGNDQLFQSHLAKLNDYYFGDLRSNINREDPVGPEKLIKATAYLKTLQQKKIFQVKKYKHPDYDELFCAYLSSDFVGDDSYFIKLFFTIINDNYKIISEYYICSDCNGTGLINNKKCNECDGKGWFWQGGIKFQIMDKPIEVKKLLEPANPVHVKEYRSH